MASVQSLQSIPRFLSPLRPSLLPQKRLLLSPPTPRHATTPAKSLSAEFLRRREAQQQKAQATPVIPQPNAYRPPSHSARRPNRNLEQKIYGPALSAADKKRMATKKYPNMMSPEGSFSHWVLHKTSLHVYITLGLLFVMATAAWWMDFMARTVFRHLLPSQKDFLHHPFTSFNRFVEVYKMHMDYTSQLYTEQRHKKIDDVERRRLYRRERQREAEERGEEYIEDPRYYVGEDGVRRRRVKRWFGIWE